MTAYDLRYAELYDLFYADKPYAEEATFIHHCLQAQGNGGTHVLELACGTGNHAFELERLGYVITATDISGDMLACAHRKKEARGSTIRLQQMDMRQITLPEHSLDTVVCLFDSIGYLQTNEAIGDMLIGVCKVLRPGGTFLFEFWHAAAMVQFYEPLRIRRWGSESGTILRISETTLDFSNQLAHVTYTVYNLGNNGSYSWFNETHTNRFFQIQEMAMLLTVSGLDPIAWYNGYKSDHNIDQNAWHIVSVAKKY